MSRPVLIVLICALVTMGPFTNNIAVPSLPAIAESMGVTFGEAQLVLSVFMIGFAAPQLVVGPLSDKHGRKPILILSLALFVLATVGAVLAPDIESLLTARLFQAIGLSGTLSIGRAMVRDSFASERIAEVYAYVGTALAVGPIAGPIFGGVIEVHAGWRMVFVFLGAVGVAMLLVNIFALRETNLRRDTEAMRPGRLVRNYATLLTNGEYLGYVLCNVMCYAGIFAYTSCSAYILIGLLGVSPDFFGLLYAITVGSYGIGTFVAGRTTARVGLKPMILYGGLVMTVAGEVLVLFPLLGIVSVWTIVLPFAVFCFGTGFVFPSGQAGAISPFPRMAGAASSMLSFLQMTVACFVGAVSARALDGTMMPMAWWVFAMGPALLLSFWLLVLLRRRRPTTGIVVSRP